MAPGGRAGLKRSGYQGGIQCPMIVRWPGKIKPGSESDHLGAHYDFLPTLADIGGVKPPEGKDGISYLPTLLGKPQTQKHEYVVVGNTFKFMGGSALITRDGWKLIETPTEKGGYQLYHIASDNEERHELSAQHPDLVERLKKTLESQIGSERP